MEALIKLARKEKLTPTEVFKLGECDYVANCNITDAGIEKLKELGYCHHGCKPITSCEKCWAEIGQIADEAVAAVKNLRNIREAEGQRQENDFRDRCILAIIQEVNVDDIPNNQRYAEAIYALAEALVKERRKYDKQSSPD